MEKEHWLIKCRSKPDTDALCLATIAAQRNFLYDWTMERRRFGHV